MIDDACSQLGRIGKRISNDDDIKALDMPLPEIDEPDIVCTLSNEQPGYLVT